MTNKQIIEQVSARFYEASNAALVSAEEHDEAADAADNQAVQFEMQSRARTDYYEGRRLAIIAYALVGTTAPVEIVGREASQDVRYAVREVTSEEVGRVGRLDTLISYSTRSPLRVIVRDLRVAPGASGGVVTVNIGRFFEELQKASDGSGADGVMRAAKRAKAPYESLTSSEQGARG